MRQSLTVEEVWAIYAPTHRRVQPDVTACGLAYARALAAAMLGSVPASLEQTLRTDAGDAIDFTSARYSFEHTGVTYSATVTVEVRDEDEPNIFTCGWLGRGEDDWVICIPSPEHQYPDVRDPDAYERILSHLASIRAHAESVASLAAPVLIALDEDSAAEGDMEILVPLPGVQGGRVRLRTG